MWSRIKALSKTVWGAIRFLLSIRSLLDVLGWKAGLMALLLALGVAIWGGLSRLPGPVVFVLFLVAAIGILFGMAFWRVWKKIPADAFAERKHVPLQIPTGAGAPGPEIVVDYYFSEDSPDHHDSNAPLKLRNLSKTEQAYNVEVQPLRTSFGTLSFEPDHIPYIETESSKNVFAKMDSSDIAVLLRRNLPAFLYRSYQDSSMEELFGVKVFTAHPVHRRARGKLL